MEEIKPFALEEATRRNKHPIDDKDIVYRQIKVTMEAMQPNKKVGFTVPKNGHTIGVLKKYVHHIEESLNNLMPKEQRDKNSRIYTVRILKDENKNEIGLRVWRDQ